MSPASRFQSETVAGDAILESYEGRKDQQTTFSFRNLRSSVSTTRLSLPFRRLHWTGVKCRLAAARADLYEMRIEPEA